MEYRQNNSSLMQTFDPQVSEPAADFSRIISTVRRLLPFAILGALSALLLAVGVLWILEPSYRSSIQILLDQENAKLVARISGEQQPTSSEEYVSTQLSLINSDVIARRVIYDLGLVYDPATEHLRIEAPENRVKIPGLGSGRVTSEELTAINIDPATQYTVLQSISAYQVGKSLVIEITAMDPDPQTAQQIASAYGRAYLTDQLSARFEAMKNAGSWLEDRINTLGEQSLKASAAVEKFRADQNLMSSNGRLVSDQQLGQLNDQLISAKFAVTRSAAKIQVLEDALRSNDLNRIISLVGPTSDTATIGAFKSFVTEYNGVDARLQEVEASWGSQNEQVRALVREKERLAGLLTIEATRILDAYRGDHHIAQSEEKSLQDAVDAAAGQSQADMSTLVMLRNLEQRATSYNSLYQDYLARYQQAVQQQTLSINSGRIISHPEVASRPVFPNNKLVLALAVFLGLGTGSGVGLLRDLRDRTFRSKADVESRGADFLGYVARCEANRSRGRQIENNPSAKMLTCAQQNNVWSDILRKTRTALDIRHVGRGQVVGVTSLQQTILKSAFALVYAETEVSLGRKVLLVEYDAQDSQLSMALLPTITAPLCDIRPGRLQVDEAIVTLDSGVSFLPACHAVTFGDAARLTDGKLFELWQSEYDIIIVDLPPAEPISEARALAPNVDGFACIVEWGKTPRQLLESLLRSSSILDKKMLGIAIADVNMKKLKLFDMEVVGSSKHVN
ncbi:hypothetical protein KHP60_24250 [Microvirga sp. 3-52]|uniref:GumC family protein n=1 Tax=Microvirga sp. 3-52 TaxID=2792425 RepID=UPI001AC16C39|nr:exopolysaccharide transport family protein [Microvirga sp. 3-52]MBO1909340.1 hypothetical protein [Microvirga sp. 3-52]MBS7455403.1 hypothetical protein [Microvirga sp. 3-52]